MVEVLRLVEIELEVELMDVDELVEDVEVEIEEEVELVDILDDVLEIEVEVLTLVEELVEEVEVVND